MKYVSIDLETTGLDPDSCDVIEFAAVVDDTLKPEVPVDDLPHFRRLVRLENYRGEPYALAMHAALFREAAGEAHVGTATESTLFDYFQSWLIGIGVASNYNNPGPGKVLVAGKNFAGFDMRFLRRLPGAWDGLFSHRVLDPAMLFALAEDVKPPSLELCLDRAGFTKTVSHRALDDARDVVRCIRSGLSRVRELSESKRTELERRLSTALMDKQAAEQLAGEAKATLGEAIWRDSVAQQQAISQAVSKATERAYEQLEELRRKVTVADAAQRAAEYELRVKLQQVDALKRQVAVLTDGSAQRRLAHLGNWQAWAKLRMTELDDEGVTGDWDWDKANPEPQFTGDDDDTPWVPNGGEG